MTNNFAVDQGESFGTWEDETSRFMYDTSLTAILAGVHMEGHIGDFGGANGLLKRRLPNSRVTTIDIDPSKNPDIVDDILTHSEPYDIAWCRYVMHYLTDQQVIHFIDNVNAPRIVLVQFANPDLRVKYANSRNETKYFRTGEQLESLLPSGIELVGATEYMVTAEFYKNRLGLEDAQPHTEHLLVYDIRR